MYNPHTVLTREALEVQVQDAVRDGDDVTKRTLRMVLSAWQLAEIDNRAPLDDQQVLKLFQREAKSRREAIEDAERAGREDLAASERQELELLETYLPQPMNSAELEALAHQAIEESGATSPEQMGQVMTLLMPRLQGRADGKEASQVVRNLLNSS